MQSTARGSQSTNSSPEVVPLFPQSKEDEALAFLRGSETKHKVDAEERSDEEDDAEDAEESSDEEDDTEDA